MNDAPWKTPRVRSGLALVLGVLIAATSCAGDNGRTSGNGGGQDASSPFDWGSTEPDTFVRDVGPQDVPVPDTFVRDVPPVLPTVEILAPAEEAAIARQAPVELQAAIDHPDGIATIVLFLDGDTAKPLEVRRFTLDDAPPAPGGEFTFALSDYFLPDGTPLPGPGATGPTRYYPREGWHTFTVYVESAQGTTASATRKVFVDETPPSLVLRDSPVDRGLQYLDVVGQIRVAFRAGDNHELKESIVEVTWDGGEPITKRLAPTETGEYLAIFELNDSVRRASVAVTALDAAGHTRTITLPVRIIGRPPYRLGHVFEFPNGAEVKAFTIGTYEDEDDVPEFNDVYPDVFVSTSDGLWLLLGAPGGQFAGGYKLLDAGSNKPADQIILYDFDRDGLEDILLLALDGTTLVARVAIRLATPDSVDRYRLYEAGSVDKASGAIAFVPPREVLVDGEPVTRTINEDGYPDLIVGLSDAEDSVGILLGLPIPDLPNPEAEDPLAGGAECDPACTPPLACLNGRCLLTDSDTCAEPCDVGWLCLQPPQPADGTIAPAVCAELDDPAVCGECGVGDVCFRGGCRQLVAGICSPACADVYGCHYGDCLLFDTADCDDRCGEGQVCHKGECVLLVGGECDPVCGEREVCQFGTCVLADPGECDPPCWFGEECHEGRCVRRCDESGCAEAADHPPFFQRPHFLRGVAGITDVDAADFNNDGVMDFVVGRTGVRQISCYLGKGDGDFLDAYDTFVDADPIMVHPVHFAGNDDALDLVVGTGVRPALHFLKGEKTAQGAGTGFFDFIRYERRGDPIPTEIATADIVLPNDLVVGYPSAGILEVWVFRQGQEEKPYQLGPAFAAGVAPTGLAVADMNADGLTDVVYRNLGTSRLIVGLGMAEPVYDFDLPPTLLMPPDKEFRPLTIDDLAVGKVDITDAFTGDDLVYLLHAAKETPETVDLGRIEPNDCGDAEEPAKVSVSAGNEVMVYVAASDGRRPSGSRVDISYLPGVFADAPVSMALGRFDGDAALDIAVAFDREPGKWVQNTTCDCVVDEETGDETCAPGTPEDVFVPNVAVMRALGDGTFQPYQDIDPELMLDESVAGIGFATRPEPGEPAEFVPESQPGVRGWQIPTRVFALNVDGSGLDEVLVFSDQYKEDPEEEGFSPAQVTVWRAPLNESGIFDGPRFGAAIGRRPEWITFIQANPTADTIADILVSNTDDDDITLLVTQGLLSFRTPRFLATAAAPRGIGAAKLDGPSDFYEDFVVAVDGNVQIGYGRPPTSPAQWAYDDVVFLAPDESYPRREPMGLEIYDINLDGRQDVLVANLGSHTVSLFLGIKEDDEDPQEHPQFPVFVDVPTARGPVKLLRAHFNGDMPPSGDSRKYCADFAVQNEGSVTLILSLPGAEPGQCHAPEAR